MKNPLNFLKLVARGPHPPTVNRSAVIIEPTQALVDWIRSHPQCGYENLSLEHVREHHAPSIYLVPEFDRSGDFWDWLEDFYPQIYFTEMRKWTPAEDLWPEDTRGLNYTVFKKYFTTRFTWSLRDMGDGRLRTEKD